jgi:hypothetical protein
MWECAKPMKYIITVISILILTMSAKTLHCQVNQSLISGSVIFRGDGLPIGNATLWVHEQSADKMTAVSTSKNGRFSIELPSGYYDVIIVAPGFVPFCKKIWAHGPPITLNVKLEYDKDDAQID